MIGQTISHYKILEKLGEGGMGVVYKAHDTKLNRNVALKFLPHYVTSDPTEKERFYHEARAASALMHPNVTVIYEIAEHDGQLYIAMEFVEGQTLRNLIEAIHESLLPIKKILDIAIQVCDGLAAAHEQGIVHRDIKSENIMFTSKGQAKIMDFGLAKVKGATKLTKVGSTLGTAAYMSPEQAQGEEVDHRSDIFSFGVVLYELLTGKLPFRGEHHAALMYSIVNEEPQPVARFNEKVTPEIEHIVTKALEKDRDDRYQHIDDLLADLRKERKKLEYAKAGYVTTATTPPVPIEKQTPKSRVVKIGLSIGLVIVLIILAVVFNPFIKKNAEEKYLATKDKSIAVMYFENRSEEKDLDKLLVDMLTTNLGRNKEISVVSGQRLYDILKNMGKQDLPVIDKSTATEVAKQSGAKTMLLGSIWKVGGKISIPAQLLDVESGAVLNSDRVEGAKPEDILQIADRLTEKVNEWLKVSQAEPVRIADAMTNSYKAYKYYEKGMRHIDRYEPDSAGINFQEAIRIDSTFVMAYYQLSRVQGQGDIIRMIPGRGLSDARETLTKAKRFAKDLPEKDMKLMEVWDAGFLRDFSRSDILSRSHVRDYPQEKESWYLLAMNDYIPGRFSECNRDFEKIIELDRSYANAYNQLAYGYCMTHEYEKAISAINTYVALIPDAWNPYDSGCDVYQMAGKPDEALKILEEGHKRLPTEYDYYYKRFQLYLLMGEYDKVEGDIQQYSVLSKLSPEVTDRYISLLYVFEGRISEAVDLLRQGVQRLSDQNRKSTEIWNRFLLGRILMERKTFKEALEEFRMVKIISEEINRGVFNPWQFVVEYYSGLCNIRKGDITQAEANASNLQSLIHQQKESFYLFLYYGLKADIELTQGKAQEALASMQKIQPWAQSFFPRIRILQARIYTLLGKREKATTIYDETYNHLVLPQSSMGGDYFDFYIERSKLDYYKAKMFEHFGDRENAIKFYKKTISNWRNGDKDYMNFVDAKAQLAKLNGGRQ